MAASFTKTVVGRRLALYVIFFSSIVTLILTCIQLSNNYHDDVGKIEETVLLIERSYHDPIRQSLWQMNDQQVRLLLLAINTSVDIPFVEIRTESNEIHKEGTIPESNFHIKEIPILYEYDSTSKIIGNLRIYVSHDRAFDRLVSSAFKILIGNGLKTFLVTLFIFFVFKLLF